MMIKCKYLQLQEQSPQHFSKPVSCLSAPRRSALTLFRPPSIFRSCSYKSTQRDRSRDYPLGDPDSPKPSHQLSEYFLQELPFSWLHPKTKTMSEANINTSRIFSLRSHTNLIGDAVGLTVHIFESPAPRHFFFQIHAPSP